MRRQGLVVLGMHRGGTSAVTGALRLLGVDLGGALIPSAPDNPSGYWENEAIHDFHERLLHAMGTTWFKPMPAGDWWKRPEVAAFKDELAGLLRRSFSGSAVWAVKDPRVCRLLPLWREVLTQIDVDVHYLLVQRHPMDVAASLAARNGFPPRRSYLLWLEHALEAEAGTREESRATVEYDRLLTDWAAELGRIAEELGLSWPRSLGEAAPEIDAFLDPGLCHHRVERDVAPELELPRWVRSVWSHRPSAGRAQSASDRAVLSGIRRDLAEVRRYIEPLTALQDQERDNLAQHRIHIMNLEAKVAELEREVQGHRGHVRNLEGELESRSAAEREARERLSREGASHAAEVEKLEHRLQEREASVADLGRDCETLRERLSALEQRHTRSLAQSEEARLRISDLEQELERTRREGAALERALESAKRLAVEQEQALARSSSEAERVARALHALRQRSDVLTTERDALDRQLARTRRLRTEQRRASRRELRQAKERELERDRYIHGQAQELEARSRRMEFLDRVAAERETQRRELEGRCLALERERLELEGRNHDLEEKLQGLLSSRSWTLTRPLRRLSGLFEADGHSPLAETSSNVASGEPEEVVADMPVLPIAVEPITIGPSAIEAEPGELVAASEVANAPASDQEALEPGAAEEAAEVPAPALTFNLEVLRLGRDTLAGAEVLFVAGWCFSPLSGRPVTLELRAEDEPLLRFECGEERTDVAAFHGGPEDRSSLPRCGFDVHFFVSEWMDEFEIVHPESGRVLQRFERPALDVSAAAAVASPEPVSEPLAPDATYASYVASNALRPHVAKLLRGVAAGLDPQPRISVLMPVFDADPTFLAAAIESVREQIYPNWELCIADDASTRRDVRQVLQHYGSDPRIKIAWRKENGNISRASNTAAELATGDFVALLDHDDTLESNALFEIARAVQNERQLDLIYSDEDKIDVDGRRYDPQFKPDYSPTLLLGYNYINHLTCVRRSVFEAAGRFRVGYEGAQDYDLLLRVVDRAREVHHIPKVLYHWRATPKSTALKPEAKPAVKIAAQKAVESYLLRHSIRAEPYQPRLAKENLLPISQFDWADSGPSVSIIIATLNKHELLASCIESIEQKTTYSNYSITVVDTGSDDAESLTYLRELEARGIQVLSVPSRNGDFSFSRVNNEAARSVDGDYLLFLNNDCEVLEGRWLSRMVGYAQLPGVGAAGARLLYPNGTIQHGGVLLRVGRIGRPDHAFRHHPSEQLSYYFLAETTREVAAVTAACMLTPRRLFLEQGGFDEERLPVSLNDVDYCLRLARSGRRTLYVANAVLTHHESMSRDKEDNPEELARFKTRHRLEDRYYNPSLSVEGDFTVAPDSRLDYAEYRREPLKVACFVPSLRLEGAPRILINAAVSLYGNDNVAPGVVAFAEGPLRKEVEAQGLACSLVPLPGMDNVLAGWDDEEHLERSVRAVEEYLATAKPDVVFVTVLNCFFVVEAAHRMGIPAVWFIQESYPRNAMTANVQPLALGRCEAAFSLAHRVVFGSEETRELFRRYDNHGTFTVLYNPLLRGQVDAVRARYDREAARRVLGLPRTRKIVLTVGTVCARKHQETFVRGLSGLMRERGGVYGVIVGARAGDPYTEMIRLLIKRHGLEDRLLLVEETSDVHLYYRAADIFAFTSLIESYSFVILEAMAHGLPIVTTLPPGVREQVRLGVNALSVPFRDAQALTRRLDELLSDEALRLKMGHNSREMFSYLPNEEVAMTGYLELARAAWQAYGRESYDSEEESWRGVDSSGYSHRSDFGERIH